MPTKTLPPTFTSAQQAIRARLATLSPPQFDALKAVLQQSAAAVDIRLAQLDAERERLTNQKGKLTTLLSEWGKSAGLDNLRQTILKGQRLTAPTRSIEKTPKPAPKTPKKPKKPGR